MAKIQTDIIITSGDLKVTIYDDFIHLTGFHVLKKDHQEVMGALMDLKEVISTLESHLEASHRVRK
ncbi:MAG: hypothetical protein GY699_09440 [Desulfobacteraceae bacterium]|nr:hypothetical protein [Desulfobacteraceae bacterium]